MYRPPRYQKDDPKFIETFIKQHPFATFITKGESLVATHIPVLIQEGEERWKLFGHIANHNIQCSNIKDGEEALVIFNGANAYVSSSWYNEVDISTWDYSAVHVNAVIKKQTTEELKDCLRKLISKFERVQEDPLLYDDLPVDMLDDHLPLITGFWLEPVKVQGVAKLHQGSGKKDIEKSIKKLENSDNPNDVELSKQLRTEHNIFE